MEYLPLTGNGFDRSHLEAQQRSAGLHAGDVSRYWHGVAVHPITGQHALQVTGEEDKAFFTPAELAALLTQEQAEAADWFLDFTEE